MNSTHSSVNSIKEGQYRFFRGKAVEVGNVKLDGDVIVSCTVSYPKGDGSSQTNRISSEATLQELEESPRIISPNEFYITQVTKRHISSIIVRIICIHVTFNI
jgi:hypothetical protein